MLSTPPDDSSVVRRAIVTGAAGSLGKSVVAGLYAAGWTVIGLDSRADAETVDVICDLASPNEVRHAFRSERLQGAKPDVLVNLVGHIHSEPVVSLEGGAFRTHDTQAWEDVLNSNLSAVFHPSVEFAKNLLATRKRGVIIGFSSVAALGQAGQVAYSAAKAGVEGMMLSLGRELAPMGIRAVAVSLGFVDVASTRNSLSAAQLRRYASMTPTRQLVQTESLISTILYIAASSDINATVLRLDGGFHP